MKTVLLGLLLLSLIVGCERRESDSASATPTPTGPNIPSLDVSQLANLTKNERDEIERRCLGANHPTCDALKSDSFRKLWELKVAHCNTKESMRQISGGSRTPECERVLGR